MDELVRLVPSATTFRRTPSLLADPTSQGLSLRAVGPSGVSRALVLVDGVPVERSVRRMDLLARPAPAGAGPHRGGTGRQLGPVRQLRAGRGGPAGRPRAGAGVRGRPGGRQPGHRQRRGPRGGAPRTGGGRPRAGRPALVGLHAGGPGPAGAHRHRRGQPARRGERPGRVAGQRQLGAGRAQRIFRRGAERRNGADHGRRDQRDLRAVGPPPRWRCQRQRQ